MAEYRFQVLDLEADIATKSILIHCSFDVDEDTVSSNIYLMQDSPKAIVPCTLSVDGKIIIVKLDVWPVPEQTYTLIIDDGIQSIVGDSMESAFPFRIQFSSDVLSKVTILAPSNFSEVPDGDLAVRWQESSETTLEHRYYIEVATENSFDNIIFKSSIDKTGTIDPAATYDAIIFGSKIAEPGQYFIRMRAESISSYGKWSETITFIRTKERVVIPNPQPGEKPRPTLPTIIDYTKSESGIITPATTTASEDTIIPTATLVTPETVTFDDLPKSFKVVYDAPVSLDNVSITVERRTF